MQLVPIFDTDNRLHLYINNVRYVSVSELPSHVIHEWHSKIRNTKRQGTLLNQIKAVCQMVKA